LIADAAIATEDWRVGYLRVEGTPVDSRYLKWFLDERLEIWVLIDERRIVAVHQKVHEDAKGPHVYHVIVLLTLAEGDCWRHLATVAGFFDDWCVECGQNWNLDPSLAQKRNSTWIHQRGSNTLW